MTTIKSVTSASVVFTEGTEIDVEPHSYNTEGGEHIEVLRFGLCTVQMRREQLLALHAQLTEYVMERKP